jgi:hypothetical protein
MVCLAPADLLQWYSQGYPPLRLLLLLHRCCLLCKLRVCRACCRQQLLQTLV